jgi:hypothetical protein
MNCATHPDREATGYCRNCGKALCPDCIHNVRGVLYCEGCLAGLVSHPPPITHVEAPNPALAATLGFIPGLGAVYNGEYVKGLVHIAIFAGIIAILNSPTSDSLQAFFGIGLACFYFYMPIEAYRTAKLKQRHAYATYYAPPAAAAAPAAAAPQAGAPVSASFAGPAAAALGAEPAAPYAAVQPPAPAAQQPPARNPLAGAVVLIALGLLILMANLGLLAGDWFGRMWPLILIGLGGWLLWKRYHEPAGKGSQQS